MTIKVTKRGVDPKEAVFIAKCTSCSSEMEYQRHDLQHCEREHDSWIHCPVCTAPVYHRNENAK